MLAQASCTADPREGVSPSHRSALNNRGIQVTIRPAVEANQAAITALVKSERLNPTDLDWRRFWVAVQGDQVVGAAQVRCHPDGSREVSSLVVARPHRNQGLASRLLDALLAGASTDLYLITGRALAGYYQRQGFQSTSIARAPRCVRRSYWLGQLGGFVISCMKRRKPRRLVVMYRASRQGQTIITSDRGLRSAVHRRRVAIRNTDQAVCNTRDAMKRCATLALLASIAAGSPCLADPVELSAFVALARPEPTLQVSYGEAPSQAIDVFLPSGPGPHPVAILVHGGCWKDIKGAGREQLRHLGPELTSRGIAVWSIGYRRANEPGGGYPGTFQDVGAAIDRLREEASTHRLDLSRMVLVGHSAGGHLALWATARQSLSPASPLHAPSPVIPHAVISLAGVGDLEAFARFVPLFCGPGILERLAPQGRMAEVSPAALPPAAAPVVMVSGVLDRLVPPYVAHDYARAHRGKPGAAVRLVDIPQAGHFDLVTPSAPAWEDIRQLVESALGPASKRGD